jgi:hypothetical protein
MASPNRSLDVEGIATVGRSGFKTDSAVGRVFNDPVLLVLNDPFTVSVPLLAGMNRVFDLNPQDMPSMGAVVIICNPAGRPGGSSSDRASAVSWIRS